MPELKRTFSKARMNKDLDERLVPPGEYRDANNIEIATSEGSDVGSVQNLKGNTEKTAAISTAPTSSSTSHNFITNAICVAAITDEKNNKIYSLIHDGLWFVAQDSLSDTNHLAISSDYILEYDVSNDTYKYVFNDIYEVNTTTSQDVSEGNVITVSNNQGIRKGMTASITISSVVYQSKVKHTFANDSGSTTESSTKIFLEDNIPAHDGSTTAIKVIFTAERVLNFRDDTKITGINILDDFLFFTDDENEPKKISISRSLAGTGGSAQLPSPLTTNNNGGNRTYHTRLYAELDTFDDIECITNAANTIPIYVEEEHITVIKKAPLTPPTLEMSATRLDRKNTSTGTENAVSSFANTAFVSGSNLLDIGEQISVTVASNVDWREGDILLCTNNTPANPTLIEDATVTFKVIGSGTNGAVTSPNTLQNTFDLEVMSIAETTPTGLQTWYFALKLPDPIFEFKFVRFAYRYKYADGEYSAFSPFSKVAFIPSLYNYSPKEGHNLGMKNELRGLKIKDYLPNIDHRPRDLVAVDILFKDDSSPNVYTVKTINRQDGKSEGLELIWPDLSITEYADKRGELEIKSELIHAVLPSNQLIRPFDNVPRKAKAQEVIGNRIVYANYLQNYNVSNINGLIKPEFEFNFTPKEIGVTVEKDYNDFVNISGGFFAGGFSIPYTIPGGTTFIGEPKLSVKSLRTYQIGVVYCDKYGRQTPVLTDKATGSINITKEYANRQNLLSVNLKNQPPSWASHYKYYIKETSDQYNNLAMDRWYDAEDGNCWISFPSAERNKVDEDTYLILKKGSGSTVLVRDKARYKILAISNEAPDHIKVNRMNLGQIPSASASHYATPTSHDQDHAPGYPSTDTQEFSLDKDKVNSVYGVQNNVSSLISLAAENKLFVKFILDDGSSSSDLYRITKVAADNTDNSSDNHFFTFTIDGIFDSDIDFLGTETAAASHNISFEKHEVENRPEFDGRFFVKIRRDQTLQNLVLDQTTGDKYLIKHSRPIHFSSFGINFHNQYDDLDVPTDNTEGGSPPDNTHYYYPFDSIQPGDSEWQADASRTYANETGNGKYIMSPLDNNLLPQHQNILDEKESRRKNYFTQLKGKWAIDNEMAAVGSAGRGVHKNNQGASNVNSYNIGGTTFFMDEYGWDRINDNARILHSGDDHSTYNKSGKNGRTGVNNTSNGYPSDIHSKPYHNVMHLSRFGIRNSETSTGWDTETKNETEILGNQAMDHEWEFTEALTTVGTKFRWEKDPDGTIYEIVAVQEQTGIRNFEGDPDDNDYNNNANKRVRYTIEFANAETKARVGFGWEDEADAAPQQFHPLVNAVDADGNAIVTVAGGTNGNVRHNGSNEVEPFNYAGLAPDGSNSLTLQIVEPFFDDATDDKISNPNPAVFETEPKESTDLDIYFEASPSYPIEITEETNEMLIPIGSTFVDNDTTHTVTKFTAAQTLNVTPNLTTSFAAGKVLDITTTYGGMVKAVVAATASASQAVITIQGGPNNAFSPHNQTTHLPYFNCISFGNGVESNRIRDDFNAPFISKGVKASTTLAERYREERRKNGLIYSGIYNSQSGINNLNQFIAGEKITKDVNPEYGSIQKIYARNGDLLTLCEDRILKVLASNKDALFNADGNPQLISSTNVLGQAIPFPGEYGISTNPESFASYANNVYFTDATRGAVMQIKGDGMAPISEVGMSDYFADLLKDSSLWKCLGTYDEKKLDYNLTVEKREDGISYGTASYDTITWSEKAGGWTSFKSYYPEQGVSINNNYYTWKNGSMWQHHTNAAYNTFYGAHATADESHITLLFNDAPSSVKSFGTLNYEGTQAKVIENDTTGEGEYYNIDAKAGWYCESINTNKQEGQVFEFLEKEGKWFNNIYGVATTLSNLDTSERSVEGIGIASAEEYSGDGVFTLTVQQDASNALSNLTMTSISTTITSGVAINDQSFTKTITITPDPGYAVFAAGTTNDLTINGATPSDDGSTTTLTGSGGIFTSPGVLNVVLSQSGDNVVATFTFQGNMPTSDLTLNVHFD